MSVAVITLTPNQ